MAESDIDWSSVASLVREMRRRLRLSHRDLAERAAVDRGTIIRIEAGKPCYISTLKKVEKALTFIDGVLTHSGPVRVGEYYLQDPGHTFIYVRKNPKLARKLPNYSQELLRDPKERLRIGKLGFVSAFQWESGLGLDRTLMRATYMECYDETAPSAHNGEELVYGVEGTTVIKVGNQQFEVNQGQTASFRPSVPHTYAPSSATIPSKVFIVMIDTPIDMPTQDE